jgi:hypothetical protein
MEEIFNQGWEAYDDGVEYDDNPYACNTRTGEEWDQGWLACEAARAGGNFND